MALLLRARRGPQSRRAAGVGQLTESPWGGGVQIVNCFECGYRARNPQKTPSVASPAPRWSWKDRCFACKAAVWSPLIYAEFARLTGMFGFKEPHRLSPSIHGACPSIICSSRFPCLERAVGATSGGEPEEPADGRTVLSQLGTPSGLTRGAILDGEQVPAEQGDRSSTTARRRRSVCPARPGSGGATTGVTREFNQTLIARLVRWIPDSTTRPDDPAAHAARRASGLSKGFPANSARWRQGGFGSSASTSTSPSQNFFPSRSVRRTPR